MKQIIISLYEVYPPASGCANVTYNFTRYLSGDKYLFQFSTKEGVEEIEENFHVINFKLPSHQRFKKLMILKRNLPQLLRDVNHICPDYIFIEGASSVLFLFCLFMYLKNKGIKSRFVYHSHNVEYELRKQKEFGLITFLTRMAEGRLLKNVNHSFAVSWEDISKFKSLYGVVPNLLPNGVDVESFEAITKEEIIRIKKKYNLSGKILLYTGLPKYKPNREAIDFLDRQVMPLVVKDFPDIKLAIIGGDVGFEREWLLNPGSIPFQEVPAFIKACDICLAPIFSGSGTRVKILEFLVAGKPVISTGKGIEGLTLKNGKHILIVENAETFKDWILELLKNPEIGEKIGKNGGMIVREQYSWENIMADFNRWFFSEESNPQQH